MAKDDYDVIVFKVLLYYYAIFKGKIVFQDKVFRKSIGEQITEGYLESVLRKMQEEELLENINFTKAWGGTYIMLSGLVDIEITASGIRYLKENGKMNNIKDHLLNTVEFISSLIPLVL